MPPPPPPPKSAPQPEQSVDNETKDNEDDQEEDKDDEDKEVSSVVFRFLNSLFKAPFYIYIFLLFVCIKECFNFMFFMCCSCVLFYSWFI